MGKIITCPNCKGNGEVEIVGGEKVACAPCEGEGYTLEESNKIPCTPCDATGKVNDTDTCNMCGGAGVIEV